VYRIQQHLPVTLESLGSIRIFTGFFTLIFFMPFYGWMGSIPDTFFLPPVFSFANFFNAFPAPAFFMMLDWLALVSLFLLTVGVQTRLFSMLFFIINLIGLSFQFSFGKIDHSIFYFLLFPIMAGAGWGCRYALTPERKVALAQSKKYLMVFALLLCFGMFTAGFPKALSWIDFDLSTSGFLSWYYNNSLFLGREYLMAPLVTNFPLWVAEFFDYSAVFIEMTPFLFLWLSKKHWQLWLTLIGLFHLGNTLFLNISFTIHIPVYLVFFGLSMSPKVISQKARVIGIALLMILTIIRMGQLIKNAVPPYLLNPFNDMETELWQAVVIWGLFLIIGIYTVFTNKTVMRMQVTNC
jgi:hypothetical protein